MHQRFSFLVGRGFRETGRSIDKVGLFLQGKLKYQEQLNRQPHVLPLYDVIPNIADNVFFCPGSSVIGAAKIEKGTVIGYGAVVRADTHEIVIGKNTLIGDKVVVHTRSSIGRTIIGDSVLIWESALIHACILEDECYVGPGAIILDGAIVQKGSIVGPGALVLENRMVRSGEYWEGSPAKLVRKVTEEEVLKMKDKLEKYHEVVKVHKQWLALDERVKDREISKIDKLD